MPLDDALRKSLLRAGEAFPADAWVALPQIVRRARSHRRRRIAELTVAAAVLGAIVWAPSHVPTRTHEVDTPPARHSAEPVERLRDPGRDRDPGARPRVGLPRDRSLRGAAAGTAGRATTTTPRRAPRSGAGSPVEPLLPLPAPRRVVERYEVAYVAGTHVGENAGTGCTRGESTMGSNDCVAIRVGEDETEIALRLEDDEGIVAGAVVYQHAGGEGRELVAFCGRTDGYVEVEPGALLLVYVDTTDRCSTDGPRSGTLTAFLR